jgi:predicted negative regulator of RcsB-dependent stress response
MTIEVSVLAGLVSIGFAIYFGWARQSRDNSNAVATEASAMTTVVNKLATIETGICEIKNEINSIKRDFKEDHDKIIRLEASKPYQKYKRPITSDGETSEGG